MEMLLMLLSVGVIGLAVFLLILSGLLRQGWLAKFTLAAVGVWFATYAALLLGVSLASEEKVLALNEPKEFCGFYFDCHMQTTVTDVRKTKTIGDKTANGEFYIIRVKIFSDAKRARLGLHDPQFEVVDADDRKFSRMPSLENPGSPFDQKVSPGGGFEKEIVFDLPEDVRGARLDIAEGIGVDKVIESVLIGDEDSIFHKRTRFKLDANETVAQN
jgi:hypothetical protein